MLWETPFTKYHYIVNISFYPLVVTNELVLFSLKYVTESVHSHWDSTLPGFPKLSNNICKVTTIGRNLYGIIPHIEF